MKIHTVLDLIDNSLDGVARSLAKSGSLLIKNPYSEFEVKINLDHDWFSIEDSCGGIPLNVARFEAFRMGRSSEIRDAGIPTVGVYGIGMKRAIFKIGREAIVTSRYEDESEFEVEIPEDWLDDPDAWQFEIREKPKSLKALGTQIMISKLNQYSSERFANPKFQNDLL